LFPFIQRALTAETALLLGRELGTGARFWMILKATYDLAKVAKKLNVAA
jgi:plasmid maintenance system antidote protein VapI